ncbi:MAG: hypothetical protein AAFY34_08010 [Pseudomonadota bacterium]
MIQGTKPLEELMKDALPETGQMIKGTGMYMECMDPATLLIWMSIEPTSPEDFKLWTPEPNLVKTGIGKAAMDMAAFRHDPTGPGTPVQTRTIGDRPCLQVAKPSEMPVPRQDNLPTLITVVKAHTLGFEAGRTLTIMTIGDEHFIEVIGDAQRDKEIQPPPGGAFNKITLKKHWVVDLPYPAATYFWLSPGGARSFQGPVSLPSD